MIRRWLRQLHYLLHRRRIDAALREEMEAHREALGNPSAFGNTLRLREESHDAWGLRAFDECGRDVGLASKALRQAPGFSLVAILSLGIAVTVTALASVIYNAYLTRPLPFAAGERLYSVSYAPPGPWEPEGLARLDWSSLSDLVDAPVTASADVAYVDGPEGSGPPYRLLRVSHGFIEGLGVSTVLGRTLEAADHLEQTGVALISQRLWRERFDGDPAVVGREVPVEIDGRERRLETFRIAGVLPDGFWFGRDSRDLVDLVTPLRRPSTTYWARLREGVPAHVAEARLTDAVRRLGTDLPPDWTGVTLQSARERYVAALRPVLRAMALACALIVAIAGANVAVLALLRTARRRPELALKLALGAGTMRIARLLAVEAALLVAVAMLAGMAAAQALLRALGPEMAAQLGRPAPGGEGALSLSLHEAAPLALVALFGLVVAGVVPVAAGAAGWRRGLADTFVRANRSSSESRGARRWRMALVTVQVAGTLTLLIACGLTTRSLLNMVRTDFGVRMDNLVRVSLDVPPSAGLDADAVETRHAMLDTALTKLAGAPVARFHWPQFYEAPTYLVETDQSGAGSFEIGLLHVNREYLDVLGVQLVRGRLISPDDRPGSEPVALVSLSAARRLWPNGEALGRRIHVTERHESGRPVRAWRTVVGVVADVRQTYDDPDLADVYVPVHQVALEGFGWFYMPFATASAWEPEVRRLAATIDSRAQVRVAVPLVEEAARQWASPRFMAQLVMALAGVSMLLAVIGIYGVAAFSAAQRSRDVAIRWALGASGPELARSLVREAVVVLATGSLAGLAGGVLTGRVLEGQLHGIDAGDPTTLAIGVSAVLAAGVAAAGLPALRAASANHLERLGSG